MLRGELGLLVRCAALGAFVAIAAPGVQAQSTLVTRADSAFAAEDRALARRLYEEVVRANPEHSRALFRLGQLEPSPDKALVFYERYVALEPRDPWGHMALGDHLARMGRFDEGLASYTKAQELAPNERDVVIGRARIESRAGRSKRWRPGPRLTRVMAKHGTSSDVNSCARDAHDSPRRRWHVHRARGSLVVLIAGCAWRAAKAVQPSNRSLAISATPTAIPHFVPG